MNDLSKEEINENDFLEAFAELVKEQAKKEAIAFNEWTNLNGYSFINIDEWVSEDGDRLTNNKLYDRYIQSKQQ